MQQGAVEERSSLIKSGVNMIDIILSRSNRVDKSNPQSHIGTTLTIKVAPEIEDFMRELGGGEKVAVAAYGRYWTPLPPVEQLMAYDLRQPIEMGRVGESFYRLDNLGNALDSSDRAEGINISFLRLVGASEGTGIRFGLKGVVYSEPALRKLKDKLGIAARQFYIDYVRPVDTRVSVVLESQNFTYAR